MLLWNPTVFVTSFANKHYEVYDFLAFMLATRNLLNLYNKQSMC